MEIIYSEKAKSMAPGKVFWLTVLAALLGYVAMNLVYGLPYKAVWEIAILMVLAFFVYRLVRYGVMVYTYALTSDGEFVVVRKIGSFQKVLLEVAASDIKKIRPYEKGDKGQNFCASRKEPKFTATGKGVSFVFAPSKELIKRIKGTTSA